LNHTVAQIKHKIAAIQPHVPSVIDPSTSEMKTPTSSNMEIKAEPPTTTIPALTDLIADLKNDIATKLDISDLIVDLKSDIALSKSHPLFCNLKPINQRTPVVT